MQLGRYENIYDGSIVEVINEGRAESHDFSRMYNVVFYKDIKDPNERMQIMVEGYFKDQYKAIGEVEYKVSIVKDKIKPLKLEGYFTKNEIEQLCILHNIELKYSSNESRMRELDESN